MNAIDFQGHDLSARISRAGYPNNNSGWLNLFLIFRYRCFIISCCAFCLCFAGIYAQTPIIDSLKKELANPKSDKLSTLFALGWQGESMPADTLMRYAKEAKQISIQNKDNQAFLQSMF